MKKASLVLALSTTLVGCDQIPVDALALAPRSLEQRQLETRRFEGISGNDLLAASAGVLQDLGFNIDESESRLGLVVASKDRDATDGAQIAAAILVALLGGGAMPVDKNQKIRASLVVSPSGNDGKAHTVRVTFQRVIWNTQGQITRSEWIREPELYQQFYEKLSKAVFLEAHKI
jgi:hypothetical protein